MAYDSGMTRPRRPAPPLDGPALDRLALRYVERFATTRAKLTRYLARKIVERGWAEDAARVDPAAVAARMAELSYVDDAAWAEAKAGSLGRRGYGPRRVAEALRAAGVGDDDAAPARAESDAQAIAAAVAFARRRRIGPFARDGADRHDRDARQKALAAMLRAGHDMRLSRHILALEAPEAAEMLLESGQF